MAKSERNHHADEFGQQPSANVGWDAPTIGAPATITVAGIVERESGRTPGPPLIPVRAVIVMLAVLLVVGVLLLFLFRANGADQMAHMDQVLTQYEEGY